MSDAPARPQTPGDETALDPVGARFGPLARAMLLDNPVLEVWRLSFVANVFTAPLYKRFEETDGVSRGEFLVLFCLSRSAGGLTAQDVCLATGRPKNSISRAVSRLTARDLVRRRVSPADRRRKELAMTEAGRALLDRLLPQVAQRMADMLAPLDEAERAAFNRLMLKIAAGAPDWADAE